MSVSRNHIHEKLSQGPWTQQPARFGKNAIEFKMEIAPSVFLVLYSGEHRASVYATRIVNGETKGLCKSTKVDYKDEGAVTAIYAALAAVSTLALERVAPKGKTSVATAELPVASAPAFKTKKAQLAWYRDALSTDIGLAYACLLAIFSMQTEQEQAYDTVTEDNGVGFSGIDGEILSSFAKQLLTRRENNPGARLSPKQEALLLKKMKKYARQYIMLTGATTDKNAVDPVDLTPPVQEEIEWEQPCPMGSDKIEW